jgi:hypothetical protein
VVRDEGGEPSIQSHLVGEQHAELGLGPHRQLIDRLRIGAEESTLARRTPIHLGV